MNYKIILVPDENTGLIKKAFFDVVIKEEIKTIMTIDGLPINMLRLLLSDGFEHDFPMNSLILSPLDYSYQDIVLNRNAYKIENGVLIKI